MDDFSQHLCDDLVVWGCAPNKAEGIPEVLLEDALHLPTNSRVDREVLRWPELVVHLPDSIIIRWFDRRHPALCLYGPHTSCKLELPRVRSEELVFGRLDQLRKKYL